MGPLTFDIDVERRLEDGQLGWVIARILGEGGRSSARNVQVGRSV